MKNTRLFFFLCIAISMVTVSCQEGPIDNPDPGKDHPTGPRTLTVSIAATKTSLNGEQPVWSENDAIWVKGITDGKDSVYTVPQDAIGNSKFTLTTWIEGDIVAVYPASAKADESPYFSVEHDQDGSFANANICVATAPETADELKFYNKTALFEIRVPEGTTMLTVSSLGKITTSNYQRGTEETDKVAINSSEKSDEKYDIVIYKGGESIPDTCFVSVLTSDQQENNVILTDLNFDVAYGDKSAMGGFPPNKLRGDTDTDNSVESVCKRHIKENEHYTLGKQYFHEYKDIIDDRGWSSTTYRWATTNIGASIDTDAGEYFAWGETKGHICDESDDTFSGYSFNMQNCPYYFTSGTKKGYSKYICDNSSGPKRDGKNTLELYDDAAFANWGGAWCMPDNSVIAFLIEEQVESEGGSRLGTGDNAIFIPAAGYANGEKRTKVTDDGKSYGRYWSSSLTSGNGLRATSVSILDKKKSEDLERFIGQPIRPYGGNVE